MIQKNQAKETPEIITWGDKKQNENRSQLLKLFRQWPISDEEFFLNLGMFLVPQTLGRVLFMDYLYRQILPIQGIIAEFGCRWGQNLSLLTSLRGIYEPFNRLRKIVGFDTFEGFPDVGLEDGGLLQGMYSTAPGYQPFLSNVLALQEQESPLPHIKKFEVIQGDASITVPEYLERNPQTIISMAYFDLDIYKPTRDSLLAVRDRLTQGSVIGFDELNDSSCPGETVALREILGLSRFSIRRFSPSARTSYIIVDSPLS